MQLYATAIARHPRAVLLGGDVVPLFASAPPAWVRTCWELIECAYAVRSCQGMHEMRPEYPPYGANMAIRADIQRQHPFRTDLGRRARQMIGGEEVDVVLRVLEAGHLGIWVPESRVQHYLPNERLSLRYVRRFFSGIGQTDVLLENDTIPGSLKLARRVLTYNLAYGALCWTSSRTWMPKLIRASLNWGMLRGRWAA
jgi:hypothetical protein